MKTPPFLHPGSRVRIVSPAGRIDEQTIFPALSWLKKKGYEVIVGQHACGQNFQFSGTDAERLSDLQEALDDRKAQAIICTRGGYGLIRIIDKPDFSQFRKHPKWLVGYSDITVLHNRLHIMGFKSIHGVMCRHFLDENGLPANNLLDLERVLSGEKVQYEFSGNPLNRRGKTNGILTGGNLSLIYSLKGTPYDPVTAGKILFIEDTGEYLYHIDRMMVSLRLAGKLNNLAGLIVGQFTDCKDNKEPFGKTAEEIIFDAVKDYDFPVCFGFPAGHDQPNLPLVLGARWKLTVTDNKCSLKQTWI